MRDDYNGVSVSNISPNDTSLDARVNKPVYCRHVLYSLSPRSGTSLGARELR